VVKPTSLWYLSLEEGHLMAKILALVYGLGCYGIFFVTFLYAIGFVANMVVPKSIDSGGPAPTPEALLINLLLLGLFAVQHSVMARPEFKARWTKIVPAPVERSTFVLLTSLILLLLFWQWRPMTTVLWDVQNAMGRTLLWGLFFLGWAQVLVASAIIDHLDLFGVRQVLLYAQGKEYRHPHFQIRGLYKYVRHPLLLGFVIAFWVTPHMTTGHLLFAVMTTAYMLIAIQLEERDLVRFHGPAYEEYRRRVPMILPLRAKKERMDRAPAR
jgi:protein-S-isoprenylcysteine O-methyltransferase Ste14